MKGDGEGQPLLRAAGRRRRSRGCQQAARSGADLVSSYSVRRAAVLRSWQDNSFGPPTGPLALYPRQPRFPLGRPLPVLASRLDCRRLLRNSLSRRSIKAQARRLRTLAAPAAGLLLSPPPPPPSQPAALARSDIWSRLAWSSRSPSLRSSCAAQRRSVPLPLISSARRQGGRRALSQAAPEQKEGEGSTSPRARPASRPSR